MKLIWLTDIHLNFLDDDGRFKFYQNLLKANSDAVLITGDIAEAPSLVGILKEMASQIEKPIYFVLGNHDYYRGQINDVREEMKNLTQTEALLYWLPASGIQMLDENTILIGQDGWADGRLGDYENSDVSLNDSRMIADLFQKKIFGKLQLLKKMQQLADRDAMQLHDDLLQATNQHPKKIIVLTHVPPFKEVFFHKVQISDDSSLPYFSSKVIGDVLIQKAKANIDIEFLVLCGHTHSKAYYQPTVNLIVKAGGTEYYRPDIQEFIYV